MQRVYTTYLVLIKILWSSSGYKNIQRSDQFLKSRLSIILTNMESKFRSPLHLEITLMFGWSYPEAQTAMWMSCDTRIQNILQKADAEQPTIQSRYQCSSSDDHIPSNESKWEDIIANEVQPQISQNLLDNWYVMKIAVTEKQMEQFIGDWHVRSWNLRSWSKKEILSLIEIGSYLEGKQQDTISVLPEFL